LDNHRENLIKSANDATSVLLERNTYHFIGYNKKIANHEQTQCL